jgi:DNA-binding MarR family transcriptional regulator
MVAVRRRQVRRALVGGQPTPTFDVLDLVEAAEEAGLPPTTTDVAAALHVDQPRASRLVAAAVAAGWIERRADPGDGRRSLLVRTTQGRAASKVVHRQRQERFAYAMSDWTPDEVATFADLLGRFVSALDAHDARPEHR